MEPIGWQLILRTVDDRVLAPNPPTRRCIARVMAAYEGLGIYVFAVADTHLHIGVLASRSVAGRIAKRVVLSLHRLLGYDFEPVRLRPIHDQAHVRSLLHYILRQSEHHGLSNDPFHESSAILDLLGLRVVMPALAGRVREHLPRLKAAEVEAHLGGMPPERLDLSLLREAACAAFALADLAGKSPPAVSARRAAAHAAKECATTAAVATSLGITARAVQRFLTEPPVPENVRAVRLQMGLWSRPSPSPRPAHAPSPRPPGRPAAAGPLPQTHLSPRGAAARERAGVEA